ncbi:MAG: UDP-N-acetylglucosamine 2-epimerase [Verrucomicrobiota bacterium]|jgi:UDP-N-acetylglucosamine 2-epimerase
MSSLALIVGTRPECIKLAPVYAELRRAGKVRPLLVSTGQHRELLDQALGSFGLKPDVDLGLMTPGQSLPELSSRVLTGVSAWLAQAKPSAVLVQGDTTTVLGAAMASFYAGIPVGHVEAGLRTDDLMSPFPEEMNRRVTSTLTRWHFCPTEGAQANLLREGIAASACHVTGNTVIDALLATRARIGGIEAAAVGARLGITSAFVASHLAAPKSRWILVTGHRRESFGPGFENICRGIRQLVDAHPDLGVVYPVHLNPQVQEPVRRLLGDHPRIALAAPAAYEDFVWLMDRCAFVLTDSGGVQEEAPSLGKPVLVMRDHTERPEGLVAGTSELVGTDPTRIVTAATCLLADPVEYARRAQLRNPYGDGNAAAKIARVMEAAM